MLDLCWILLQSDINKRALVWSTVQYMDTTCMFVQTTVFDWRRGGGGSGTRNGIGFIHLQYNTKYNDYVPSTRIAPCSNVESLYDKQFHISVAWNRLGLFLTFLEESQWLHWIEPYRFSAFRLMSSVAAVFSL